ncbi:ADP-ribosylglycohydrolase family protein [Flavobacterium sp. AC]|uniref:ADP-ribosylglycohydrolase family protein n=1 Tax=Flavobacterium azizsancarii TaxID=2961580 RepID=A0ABT4W6N8_9FLAO|nr:ADP-ribosylglycohydrolase family protein [Flavobacterium azizsancarii]MDA6068235.1 ADP-ribosylglycohydrolase family protein [Flavobacterium azizsancarii]
MENKIESGLFGVAIGDALGVPVEFKSREYLKINPVIDMMGFMCWHQPPGTFSDDSSLAFCTAESLCKGFDIEDMGITFVKWMQEGYWGAHNKVFDIGGTTKHSLARIVRGDLAKDSGNFFEEDNGNGSLMRILPLVFYLQKEKDIEVVYKSVKAISSITHAHFRSVFACFIYVVVCLEILKGKNKADSYKEMQNILSKFLKDKEYNPKEIQLFDRILQNNISEYPENKIESSGYVLHSLEASLWCFLHSDSYEETVLKAVNLGGDTDTTAAIAGGLAGIYYGIENIPQKWIEGLARANDIKDLAERLSKNIK